MPSLWSDPQPFELFCQDNLLGTTPASAKTVSSNWQYYKSFKSLHVRNLILVSSEVP
jgi:hypothetical protein